MALNNLLRVDMPLNKETKQNLNHFTVCYKKEHSVAFKTLSTKYARGVVVIAVGNEQGDTSSNPGRD